MEDDEELYREMNEEDDFYMGGMASEERKDHSSLWRHLDERQSDDSQSDRNRIENEKQMNYSTKWAIAITIVMTVFLILFFYFML